MLAAPAPKAMPAASSQGRNSGEGGLSGGMSRSASSPVSSARAGVRRSIHCRSRTRNRNPARANVATKMSSIATRDCTKFRLSVARRRPAAPAHSALPNNRKARMATRATEMVPNVADAIR